MGISDALSRRADHGSGTEDNSEITLLTPGFFAVHALEGLEIVVKDPKTTCTCSVHSAEWSLTEGILYFHEMDYVPDSLNLHRQIMALCHDSCIAGHPGKLKTLELLVASDILVHREVRLCLRPLPSDKTPKAASS